MPNHIHLIIRTRPAYAIKNCGRVPRNLVVCTIKIDNGTMWASSPTQSISQLIKSFKILVAKEVGKPIFQRSFYDHVIRDEEDYLKIWNYIDTNPAKWHEDKYYK